MSDKNSNKKNPRKLIGMLMLSVFIVLGFNFVNTKNNFGKEITFIQFNEMVENGDVKEVIYGDNNKNLIITDNNNNNYHTSNPKYPEFKKDYLEKGIKITENNTTVDTIMDNAYRVLMIGFIIAMIVYMGKGTGGVFTNTNKELDDGKIPSVKFDDISGLEDVKKDLKLAVEYLKNPQEFTAIGAKMPTGMIFYGSPGTGKTLLAKAIAGEAGVPFFHKSGSDFVELFVGKGAKTVRDLFAEARKKAPCIVFIDEIDAVGKKRGNGVSGNDEREQTLNEFLNQLDGFENNEGILVISATNRLETLDEALIRPGRFGKHINIPKPKNAKERLDILNIHAKDKFISKDVLRYISEITRGFSGADLENLLNESALLQKLSGESEITLDLVDKAYFKIATKGSKIHSKERNELDNKVVAWHESGHTIASKLYGQDFYQVTISGSTSGVGGATFTDSDEDKMLKTLKDLECKIKCLYAGRVAESLILGDNITVGASNDIMVASNLIKDMVTQYGMSTGKNMLNYEIISDEKLVAQEVTTISKRLYDEVTDEIKANQDALEDIANSLLENETLYEIDIDKILLKHESTKHLVDIEKHELKLKEMNDEKNTITEDTSNLIVDKTDSINEDESL